MSGPSSFQAVKDALTSSGQAKSYLASGGGVLRLLVRDGDAVHSAALDTGALMALMAALAPDRRNRLERQWRFATAPAPFAAFAGNRPVIAGIVNVTPDSFSDGGETFEPDRAVARGFALVAAGADMVDVGGCSTRPGAAPVPEAEEMARVLPVVGALAASGVPVSIDTSRARVMAAAVEAGAKIVNDVTALTGEEASLRTVSDSGAAVVLMHMRGTPETMQGDTHYADVVLDVYDYLEDRVDACLAAGLARHRIAVDPGIGFGKSADGNARLLACIGLLRGLGVAVMVGVSRKSFIARLSGGEDAKRRLPGSIAAGLAAVHGGAGILRVHDVAETRQALDIWRAIQHNGPP